MRVVLVQNLPPNVTEEEIVAALEIYGPLKSFGICKSTGFADYKDFKDAETAVKGTVIIRNLKVNLFFGDSVTKKYRKPKEPSYYDRMFAWESHSNALKSQKKEREICYICNFENIPNTRYCSGCRFDKWNPK